MIKKLIFIFLLFIPSICFSKTYVLVHPTGFSGSELIKEHLESTIQEEDNVIWLSDRNDREWDFCFSYDQKIIAPAGIVGKLIITDDEVYFCGGYYRACFSNAVFCALSYNPYLKIRILSNGVYYHSSRTLRDQMEENSLTSEAALDIIELSENEAVIE